MDNQKKRRTSIKHSLTCTGNHIQEQMKSGVPNLVQVKLRLDKIEKLFEEFEEIQNKIEEQDENETEREYREEIEEKYFEIKSQCLNILKSEDSSNGNSETLSNILQIMTQQQAQTNTILNKLLETSKSVSLQNNSQTTNQIETTQTSLTDSLADININATFMSQEDFHKSNTQINSFATIPTGKEIVSSHVSTELKLPTINIPIFTGQYTDWPAFRDIFASLVHDNPRLSSIQKFQFLKTSLKEEAASILKHLTISDSNYLEAWDELNARYNKEKYIIDAHLKNICDYPSLPSTPSATALRKLCNTVTESVRALKALKLPTISWDCWLLFTLVNKLDAETRQLWARKTANENRPTFQQLIEFLDNREFELQSINPNRKHRGKQTDHRQVFTATTTDCILCKENHMLYKCVKFLNLTVPQRQQLIQKERLCPNCLKSNHQLKNCKSSECRVCHKRHHTLIHEAFILNSKSTNSTDKPSNNSFHINSSPTFVTVIPTAIIYVFNGDNQLQPCRALLDTGSQTSLITESCAQKLRLKRTHARIPISGLGSIVYQHSKGYSKLQIKPTCALTAQTFETNALIVSKLSQLLPSQHISIDDWKDLQKIDLADKSFNNPGQIDILIGADLFFDILLEDRITLKSGLTAQNTVFGYIVGGRLASSPSTNSHSFHVHIDAHEDIDNLLQQFWKLEDIPKSDNRFTIDEQLCETHYAKTVRRQPDGRYVVRLPFKSNTDVLGESKSAAFRSLKIMENKFNHDKEFQKLYSEFMNEYLSLNHMCPTTKDHPESETYYIPHHAVFKDSSTTTKLRVVFNASKPSSTGTSLNQKLLVGSVVQDDLISILMRFRVNRIAFCADIAKMYRQIILDDEDTKFQKILWRNNSTDPVQAYELKTVTYGTASAPFLATRTLNQLAEDEKLNFPIGAEILKNAFYVDDAMSGANDINQAVQCVNQLTGILASGCFDIRKWATNSKKLLDYIPEHKRELQHVLSIDETKSVKTLGLNWNIENDFFFFKVRLSQNSIPTKRQILSDMAKIFDPFGWLAPCVTKIKIILQRLWISGVSWDAELPTEINKEWTLLHKELNQLEKIKITRWIPFNHTKLELHVFADSSEHAYAAVVYLRTTNSNGIATMHLLASKSRVSPIKQVSLPKLELCAAHLAVKLLVKTKDSLKLPQIESYGWTDSTIVLAWLADIPRRWETFIANRTAYILEELPRSNWRHISSSKNPADCASRGINPSNLVHHTLWWNGPDFLLSTTTIPEFKSTQVTNIGRRKSVFHVSKETQYSNDLLTRYSSLTKLKRITALCLRFYYNTKSKSSKITGYISTSELQTATLIWIRHAQADAFAKEIQIVRNKQNLPKRNKLASLAPFLDSNSILRVGGRLEEAKLGFNRKHPAILPKGHKLTDLIIHELHLKYLHCGQRLLTSLVVLDYWIIGCRQTIKRIIFNCTTCTRFRASHQCQQMGNLPAVRLEPARPFSNTGLDYAGPFMVRSWKGRGSKSFKTYIAVFVCLAIKAYHLELITSLSTEDFLAAFKRFISRRGLCSNIYSDNGTAFVGANRQLKEIGDFLRNKSNQEQIVNFTGNQNITWHFIPPHAPHFGGIWESGMKAVKYHLIRVIGNALLTFEEMQTLLCQIEAVLNSRPISPKSLESTEYEALTPAHFLIGSPLVTTPEADYTDKPVNRLSR